LDANILGGENGCFLAWPGRSFLGNFADDVGFALTLAPGRGVDQILSPETLVSCKIVAGGAVEKLLKKLG